METAEADDAARSTDESFILVVLVSGRGGNRKALGLVYLRVWVYGEGRFPANKNGKVPVRFAGTGQGSFSSRCSRCRIEM